MSRQIAAVRRLHERVRFHHAHDEGAWYETAAEAAAEYGTPIKEVGHTDICTHCGGIETAQGGDHLESLWPCATIRAIT